MEKIKIGISIGDINGIGPEIIIKTFSDDRISSMFTPVIYGSSKVLSYYKNIIKEDFQFVSLKSASGIQEGKINVVNCWEEDVKIEIGALNETGGRCAYMALDKATQDLKSGLIDALVTAPINKKAMELAKFPYPGHTEFLTKAFETKESLMLMVNEGLRVGLVTNHLPLKDVATNISREKIKQKLIIFNKTLKEDFGIEKPKIAVLGLNPHAGDNGVLGKEDEELIKPFLIEAKKKGIMAMGPFPADGFFGNGSYKKFDGVLAMYHDQGLVPFKTLSFGNGINFTAGLSKVRTSPDHGTAHDIAGKNIADISSFRSAIFLALDVVRQRKHYKEIHLNPVKKVKQENEKQ